MEKQSLKISLKGFIILIIALISIVSIIVAIIFKSHNSNKTELNSNKIIEKSENEVSNNFENIEENVASNNILNNALASESLTKIEIKGQNSNTIVNNDVNNNKNNDDLKKEQSNKTDSSTNKDDKKEQENKYDNKYCTVSFDTAGGTTIKSKKIKIGTKVGSIKLPTKEGYTFKMWTLNGEEFDLSSVISKDINLVAKWEEIYEPIISNTININQFTYKNGTYFYNFQSQCWSDNVTLQIAKNSKDNIIQETYTSNGTVKNIKLPINRGETATFYFRVYINNNGMKEYSKYVTTTGTAPIEDYDNIHLVAPSVSVNNVDEKNIQLSITSNDYSEGYFMYVKNNNSSMYGNTIGKPTMYNINKDNNPSEFKAYLNGNLYIDSYVTLSNGYLYHSEKIKIY